MEADFPLTAFAMAYLPADPVVRSVFSISLRSRHLSNVDTPASRMLTLQVRSTLTPPAPFRVSREGRLPAFDSSRKPADAQPIQRPRPEFRVLVSDRDSMSGNLLASALVRQALCHATAVPPGNLLASLAMHKTDLVVIGAELSVKGQTGFDFAGNVARMHPEIFVVMILNESTRTSVINAFRSGARGLFSREGAIDDFLNCIEHVRKGMIWAGGQDADFLLEALRNIPAPNVLIASSGPQLTSREMQVVQLAATGKTNKVIASELNLSEHTVKNYLFRAFDKLGISSRVELLFYLTMRGHTFGSGKSTSDPDGDQSTD